MNSRHRAWFALGLVAVGAVTAVALYARSVAGRDDYRQRYGEVVAALRAKGEPVTFDEYLGDDVPEGENGADLLEEAWLFLENELQGVSEPPDRWDTDEEWFARSAAERHEVARKVRRVGPFYDLVRRALERPRLRFERVETQLPGISTSGVGERLQDIMLVEGWLHSLDRVAATDAERLDAFGLRLALADRLRDDESSAVIVALAAAKRAVESMRAHIEPGHVEPGHVEPGHVESGHVDPAAALERLDASRGGDWRAGLASLLREERLRVMMVYEFLLDGGELPAKGRTFSDVVKDVFGTGRPRARPLRTTDIDAVVRFCEGTQDLIETLPAEASVRGALYVEIAGTGPEIVPISSFVKRIGRLDARLVGAEARIRLARVALAVAAHHRERGTWPAVLEDVAERLGGAIPPDPHTGRAFFYETVPGGVRVRSAPEFEDLVWELRD